MLLRKAFRYKLKTTPDIDRKCLMMAGCCRLVWNKALALNWFRLENKQPLIWYNEAAFWLKLWKSSDELSFLKDCHSQPLQQTLKNLELAFKDGFDKKQPLKRIPNYKKKGQHDSFRFPQGFKVENSRLYLPKIGWVNYFNSRKLEGKPKNLTVTKEADGWYASIQVEIEQDTQVHPSASIIGCDLGIKRFVTLSDKTCYEPLNSFRTYQKQLANAQCKLKNKTKFSNNWKKQQRKIGKIHHKIANCRKDQLHWISTQISKSHAVIVLEDLKVKNMSASAKGSIDQPGRNVKAKSGLNKSILDQGWSMFTSMLEYKQRWRNGEVIYVPPHHTSQTCPVCNHVSRDNRKSQADFECGFKDNADFVGAINVLARGAPRSSLWRSEVTWIDEAGT